MNIYADRGNLLMLQRRCAWRGIDFQLTASGLGEPLRDEDSHDLYYLGGGQDRDQRLCAEDLVESKRDALRSAAARGAVIVGVCGGYQLLGHSYVLGHEEIPGLGLVDLRTVREDAPRLIGNVAIEVQLDPSHRQHRSTLPGVSIPAGISTPAAGSAVASGSTPADQPGRTRVLAGFENHGGRTYLGSGERALGRVLRGHGNDGRSGLEGVRRDNVIGTYLHGPLLPKNSWFADWLIATALDLDPGELAPLDDELELQAHQGARRAAGL
jgi:CobQ-like glutamine amidotransferase family enzyme